MKLYDQTEATEYLSSILLVQDKTFLAKELAKVVVRYTDKQGAWSIKDTLSVIKDENKFVIRIGDES
jgi:hypothetical protein